jgi:AcrR family transcriptional regulator
MPRSLREDLILEVAGQTFAAGGYDRASMDQIAGLAGVSKPMLYTYFGSKEGLYVAYIDRIGSELLDRLVAAGPVEGGLAPAKRAMVEEFLAFVEQYRDGWTVLFREMTASRPLADRVAEVRGRIAGTVRRMLEDSTPAYAKLSAPASDAVAHAIVGAGESLANWWLDHHDVPRAQVADWYVEIVSSTIAATARSTRPPPLDGSQAPDLGLAGGSELVRAPVGAHSSCSKPTTGESVSSATRRTASSTPGMND